MRRKMMKVSRQMVNEAMEEMRSKPMLMRAVDASEMREILSIVPNARAGIEGLAVLSVVGPLNFHASYGLFGDKLCSDYKSLMTQLEKMKEDESVKSVLLFINSPGGMADGMFEACDKIRELAEVKNVEAYIDEEACSAAYALAVSTNKVTASPSARTGCCGCYAEAWEQSEESLNKNGILTRIFRSKNAPMKNQSVITDEQAAKEYQARIDELGERYLNLCAERRGITEKEKFGEGRVVDAEYALANGMIDAIDTFENVLDRISGSLEESEGEESVKVEDFTKLSAEEQKDLMAQMCKANPELLESYRSGERDRIAALNAMKVEGCEAVNTLVDTAIADGKSAGDIALEAFNAYKDYKAAKKAEQESAINAMAEATQNTPTPAMKEKDENPYLKAANGIKTKEN
jgi:Periplasmic serine proteases (ClpP class)